MVANVTTRRSAGARRRAQAGFTLIEVLIAIVVLTVGLVALLSVFGIAVAATQRSQQDMIAKQLAAEAMENIFTARNTDQVDAALGRPIQWDDIQNAPDGIFIAGAQPIHEAGADGIIGTADDALAATRALAVADADGVIRGNTMSLNNFTRQIQITNVPGTPAVRGITVVVFYRIPGSPLPRSYTLAAYISQYR